MTSWPAHRRLPEKERQRCAEVHRRRAEADRTATRLRRDQRLQAKSLRHVVG
jgi:hypothetical protein